MSGVRSFYYGLKRLPAAFANLILSTWDVIAKGPLRVATTLVGISAYFAALSIVVYYEMS